MYDTNTSSSARSALRRALVIGVAATFGCTVQADCGPLIAAYGKADATKRYALYEVDSIAQAPKGEPMIVTMGNVEYTQNLVGKSALQIVTDGYKKGGHASGFEADSLRSREQKGEVRCEPLGERQVGADQAIGYQIRNNDKGNEPDFAAIDVWLNRSTGLPLFHGMGSDGGGFRWVFGPGVLQPAADKVRN
jgi:hypothetical protein